MKEKPKIFRSKTTLCSLTIVCGLIGLLIFIAGGLGWQRAARQQALIVDLNQHLAAISGTEARRFSPLELQKLSEEAERLGQPSGQIEYAKRYVEWQQALEHFDQIGAALENRYLKTQAREMLTELHDKLLALRNTSSEMLENDKQLNPNLLWKIHNLKGCASVLLAYSVLYFEEDGRKAAKFLSDALEDFKLAIHQVDQANLSSLERTIPRWNMELIVNVGEYRVTGIPEIPQADIEGIRDQLQAFIPDVPGFSPGIPIETRVQK